jgi:alpha-glucosidase
VQQYNLIGSHDVSRIRTMTGGNDALHRMATLILITFPGVPSLYYGDEIGMEDDPSLEARGCMIWDDSRWDHDLLDFHKRLIALRKESKTLQRGGFQMLLTEVDTLAYQREGGDDTRFIIVAHRGEEAREAAPLLLHHADIADGTVFTEFFSGQQLTVIAGALPLPALPQGATLWQAAC